MARQRNPATAPTDRLFLDTGYVIARFNRRDEYHNAAKQLAEVVIVASELWTTDAVLLEIAAAFSAPAYRPFAIAVWDEFHGGNDRCHLVEAAGVHLANDLRIFLLKMGHAFRYINT